MNESLPMQHIASWEHRAESPVEHLAVSPGAEVVLAADADRCLLVLGPDGEPQGTFKTTYPVAGVWAQLRGEWFAALAGSVVYSFDAEGEFRWRVELDEGVTDFDLGLDGQLLAAGTAGGKLYLYDPETYERRVAVRQRSVTAVRVVSGTEPRVLMMDEAGRLAMLDAMAVTQWQKELGSVIGGVCVAPTGEQIIAIVPEVGLVRWTLDGEELDPVELDQPAVRVAAVPDGSLFMVERADHTLALIAPDGAVCWKFAPKEARGVWGLGMDAQMVAVVEGADVVRAYKLRANPASETRHGRPSNVATEHEYLEVERIISGGPVHGPVAGASRHHLRWKKRLPDDLVPEDESRFRLNLNGDRLLMVLEDGTVVVLDQTGKMLVRAQTPVPASVVPRLPTRVFGVWSEASLLRIDPGQAALSVTTLGPKPVKYLDCAGDGSLVCAVDASGVLRAYKGSGNVEWERAIEPAPVGVFVSPQGKMVLVPDQDGRNRFFNSEGRLLRKFRFADPQGRLPLALGDGFSVYGAGGHLVVLDASGKELWAERLFERTVDLELFGMSLAVYGEGGACAAIDPLERLVWDFWPPQGRSRLRKPSGADPLVVHAAGRVVTGYSGYGSDLSVLWCFECDDEVTLFDVDRQGRAVVVLAGPKLYWIEAGTGA